MFLNRFRSLFAEVLPTVVWWPSSPEGRVCGQRTVTVVPYLTHNKYGCTITVLLYHTTYIWNTAFITLNSNIPYHAHMGYCNY